MLSYPCRLVALFALVFAFARTARADEVAEEPSPAETHEAGEEHPPAPAAEAEHPAAVDHAAAPAAAGTDAEYDAAFADIPNEVAGNALDDRPEGAELAPSLTPEQMRHLIEVARAKVLTKMMEKIEKKSDARMEKIGDLIGWFSLAGLLLLFMPLVLRKRYPGRGMSLLKYSALAAVTFVLTVNLFGIVVMGFRGAQSGLGSMTNPQLRIANAFFDAMSEHAEDIAIFGKELFGPSLEQMSGDSDAQPMALLIENGQKVIKDADVFITIAKSFKKLDVVFGILPTVMLLLTMVLFIIALKPTLLEIVRLPIDAAEGRANGKAVVKRALRRIGGEMLAALCTIGVLIVITLIAGVILGAVIGPALTALLEYFTFAVMYLQFVEGASSGAVFVMLFAVILFLVMNLVAVIAGMTLFLGKSQKIFQRKFNDRVPLRAHKKFWLWGSVSLLVAQIVPWLYIVGAGWLLEKINDKLSEGVTDVASIPWKAIMLIGPLFLVVGFATVFWAARGIKSLKFLATYRVPVPQQRPQQQQAPTAAAA